MNGSNGIAYISPPVLSSDDTIHWISPFLMGWRDSYHASQLLSHNSYTYKHSGLQVIVGQTSPYSPCTLPLRSLEVG